VPPGFPDLSKIEPLDYHQIKKRNSDDKSSIQKPAEKVQPTNRILREFGPKRNQHKQTIFLNGEPLIREDLSVNRSFKNRPYRKKHHDLDDQSETQNQPAQNLENQSDEEVIDYYYFDEATPDEDLMESDHFCYQVESFSYHPEHEYDDFDEPYDSDDPDSNGEISSWSTATSGTNILLLQRKIIHTTHILKIRLPVSVQIQVTSTYW